MSALTVLLVEDDSLACRAYRNYADGLADVTLVGITDEAGKALELIKDHLPQAIILDLELQKGAGSGLDVLRGMQDMDLGVKPFALIVTNNISPVIQRQARKYDNIYIISKYQRDYSEAHCLDFLRELAEEIQTQYHSDTKEHTDLTHTENRDRIIRRIHAELNNVYISPRMLGYKYLTDGIYMTMQEPRQNLCDDIAARYGKTPISVIRAMQNAIKRAWKIADLDELAAHYTAKIHPEKGMPTVLEFVFYYADKLKGEYQL